MKQEGLDAAERKKKYRREWYAKNREAVRRRARAWRAANREKVNAGLRRSYLKHRERRLAEVAKHYRAHKDAIKVRMKRYRSDNADALREYQNNWRKSNRAKERQHSRNFKAKHPDYMRAYHKTRYYQDILGSRLLGRSLSRMQREQLYDCYVARRLAGSRRRFNLPADLLDAKRMQLLIQRALKSPANVHQIELLALIGELKREAHGNH